MRFDNPIARFVCLALLLLGGAAMAGPAAVASWPVPLDHPSYRWIEVLAAHRLIHSRIYAQRPYSQHEVARLTIEAQAEAAAHPERVTPFVAQMLRQLEDAVAPAIRERRGEAAVGSSFNPLASATVELQYNASHARPVPVQNGVGAITATIDPLTAYRQGRVDAEGPQLALETEHTARLGRHVACRARPRLFFGYDRAEADSRAGIDLLSGSCQFVVGGVAVTLGREGIVWGQSEVGGILLSSHARPLDVVQITNAHPFFHPWILRYLGPSKYSVLVANLGPHREFPYAFLVGFATNVRPYRTIEFGFYHTYLLGGRGAPALHWYDPLSEFAFARAPGMRPDSRNLADHRAGVNLRWEVPGLRGTALFVEGIFEDLGRSNVWANFADVSGYLLGLEVPRLDREGRWGVRVEYRDLPAILYRHHTFTDGYTLNGRILGDPLGPDGRSVRVGLDRTWNEHVRSTADLWWERRDSNTYVQTLGSGGGPNRVAVADDRPAEQRFRAEVATMMDLSASARLRVQGGVEYVSAFDFVPGDARVNGRVAAVVEWRFDHWWKARRPTSATAFAPGHFTFHD